jgi:hemerythrin superfamily protein
MARSKPQAKDAIALLKADHREVEALFEQFENARDDEEMQELANSICSALKIHTVIEEEIFYPAFLEAADDLDIHHEAEIEHNAAKNLIAAIEACSPDNEYFSPTVKVLSEMIKHHVKEEEKPGGMFAVARESDMDLVALGAELAARKTELESSETGEMGMPPPEGGARGQGDRTMKETR